MSQTFIGFGWNPWWFFIVLLLAVGIAWAFSRIQLYVFWLLPALVLYAGINWGFEIDWWIFHFDETLFKVIFWVAVVVVIIWQFAAVRPSIQTSPGWSKLPMYLMIGLIVILLFFRLIGAATSDDLDDRMADIDPSSPVETSDGSDIEPSDSPTSSSTPTVSPSGDPSDEPSDKPSDDPSSEPSQEPTQGPSDEPSVQTVEDELEYYGAPATIPSGTCPGLTGWNSLVQCVEDHDLQWYVDGLNARAGQTGFDWTDVQRWAEARTPDGLVPEARYVQVFGQRVDDPHAAAYGSELTGTSLHTVRQAPMFHNTRGIEAGRMTNFDYNPPFDREVRVSLMPLVLNDQGEAIGVLDRDSGVFIDCLNVWWS